jgi:hypothetical protein
LEDEGQRTELTREERERRATVPFLRRLVSERHGQEQQRIEADARARRLGQEVDKLDGYNMERLQVKSEALDLRTEVQLHRSAVSVHRRMSSSLHIQEDKTAPLPSPTPRSPTRGAATTSSRSSGLFDSAEDDLC